VGVGGARLARLRSPCFRNVGAWRTGADVRVSAVVAAGCACGAAGAPSLPLAGAGGAIDTLAGGGLLVLEGGAEVAHGPSPHLERHRVGGALGAGGGGQVEGVPALELEGGGALGGVDGVCGDGVLGSAEGHHERARGGVGHELVASDGKGAVVEVVCSCALGACGGSARALSV
jgi:hypothetical protein